LTLCVTFTPAADELIGTSSAVGIYGSETKPEVRQHLSFKLRESDHATLHH
jgi:hypothetical protein